MQKPHATPRLSLVIVNYDSWADVLAQVAVISQAREFQDGQVEVIVVDNNSPGPKPAHRPALPGLLWLDMPANGGFAAGVNAGWAAARGAWLLLLNPDVEVGETLLGQVLVLLDEIGSTTAPAQNIGIVGIGLTNPDGSRQPSVGTFPTVARGFMELFLPRNRRRYQIGFPQNFTRVDWVTGAFFLLRTSLMQQLGGFDEDYFLYFEETDFCHRARQQGWQTWFQPGLQVCHQKPLQNRAVSPIIRLWTRHSRLLYFRKNRSPLEFQLMLRVVRLESLVMLCLARLGLGAYPPAVWQAILSLTTAFARHQQPLGPQARDWAMNVVAGCSQNTPGRPHSKPPPVLLHGRSQTPYDDPH